jgi:hypothetical protein
MLEKIDAREVYGDEGDAICHPPVCECEGCKLPLPQDGYLDAEQASYYNGHPYRCEGYTVGCNCGECMAKQYRRINGRY